MNTKIEGIIWSFFAFTATPKHKTLAVFGREDAGKAGQPFHRYTMRQAIEEGFILDVLKHYTTYSTFYQLGAVANEKLVPQKKAKQALAQYAKLHPHNIAQKVVVIVEHFREHVAAKMGGKAKAMADVPIHFAVDDMQIAEDLQLIIGHMIMQWLCDSANSAK